MDTLLPTFAPAAAALAAEPGFCSAVGTYTGRGEMPAGQDLAAASVRSTAVAGSGF